MQATFYGQKQDQDNRSACSYSENAAHSMNMSWTLGAALSLAINKDMFDGSKACGTCVMYRGVWMGFCCMPRIDAGISLNTELLMQVLVAGLGSRLCRRPSGSWVS